MLTIECASFTMNWFILFVLANARLYVGKMPLRRLGVLPPQVSLCWRCVEGYPVADLLSHGWVQASAAADEAAAKHARANKTMGKVSGVPAGTCFRCGDFVFVEADKAGSAYTHHEWRQKFKADEARQRGEDPKNDRNRGAGKNKIASMLENSLGKMEMQAKKSTEDEYLQDEAAKNKKQTLCAYCLDELSKDVGNRRFALGIQRARDRAVKA